MALFITAPQPDLAVAPLREVSLAEARIVALSWSEAVRAAREFLADGMRNERAFYARIHIEIVGTAEEQS